MKIIEITRMIEKMRFFTVILSEIMKKCLILGIFTEKNAGFPKSSPENRRCGKACRAAASQFLVLTILRFFCEKSSDCFRWLSAKTSRCSAAVFPLPPVFRSIYWVNYSILSRLFQIYFQCYQLH